MVIVGATDTQGIHPVLQHAPADTELGGGVGLNVVIFFQCIEDDLPFKFHHGFLEREASGKGVVSKGGGSGVVAKIVGRCSGVTTSEPFDQIKACSMMFSISRTLPGHGIAGQELDASLENSWFGRLSSSIRLDRKCFASSGMSSPRSRSGGRYSAMTLIR